MTFPDHHAKVVESLASLILSELCTRQVVPISRYKTIENISEIPLKRPQLTEDEQLSGFDNSTGIHKELFPLAYVVVSCMTGILISGLRSIPKHYFLNNLLHFCRNEGARSLNNSLISTTLLAQ